MSLYEITAFSLNYTGPVRNLCLMPNKFLRYDEQEVYNSTAKFVYEEARSGRGFGVHFRCLHNNKYLTRHATLDWIVAEAKEPVEDTKRRDCTLFRVETESNTTVSWVHVGTNRTVSIVPANDQTESFYLTIRDTGARDEVICTPIDVERIIKLPKTILFKGDNDLYLGAQGDPRSFVGNDRYRKELWYETFPVNNGDVRLRSVQNQKFLRRGPQEIITADTDNTTSADSNTVFQIVRLVDNSIALINRGNGKFCQRASNRFKAEIDSGVKESQLIVEEPIIRRTIQIEYRLDDARIYGEEPRSWLSQVAFNGAGEGDLTTTLTLSYEESMSFTHHATNTVTTNMTSTTEISAGTLFVSASQTLELSRGTEKVEGFEDTVERHDSYEFSCTVTVPPGQKRRARVMALEAKCDVPFSYVQTDVTATGEIIKTELQDGVYKGMNGYEFHVQVFDPDEPATLIFDEPIATRLLPDTAAREKIYLKKKN